MVTVVTFERRTGNADDGKIVIVATNDGLTSTIEGDAAVNLRFRVTAPSGVLLDTITSGAASVTGLALAAVHTEKVTIPSGPGGDVSGDYLIEMKVEVTANTADNVTLSGEFEYCPENKTALSLIGNCQGPSIQLKDKTDYGGYARLTRVLTLVHPEVNGVQPDNSVTGASLIVAVPTHSNVSYVGNITTTVQKTEVVSALESQPDEFTFYHNMTWTGSVTLTFQCATSFKELAKCYTDKLKALASKACRIGGYRALSKDEFDLMTEMQSEYMLYQIAKDCYDYDGMNTHYNNLKNLLNCNCCGAGSATPLDPTELAVTPSILDVAWSEVPSDSLRNSWLKAAVFGEAYLKWKVVNGVLYMTGNIVKTTASTGKTAQAWLYSNFLTSVGVEPTENFRVMVSQVIGAGSNNLQVGWIYEGGGSFYFQANPNFDPDWPIAIDIAIPLA